MEWNYLTFSLEPHRVTTEDGYQLTLTRLVDKSETSVSSSDTSPDVANENKQTSRKKPAVLLVHGLTSGSHQWFELSPEQNLPVLLAKEGYDCWHANFRGSPLSKSHEKMKPKSAKFWDFSFHEMGMFDLPAMINYICDVSGNESLFYIGHSMGCSTLFALASSKPNFCSKITAMVALAPAVYGEHVRVRLASFAASVLPKFRNVRMVRNSVLCNRTVAEYTKTFIPPFLNRQKAARRFGAFGGMLIGAMSHKNECTKEQLNEIAKKYPASTSYKTVIHGLQCLTAKKFQLYDYGASKNLKLYGVRSPPLYDLSKVAIPMILFHSTGDRLTTSLDGQRLEAELPQVKCNTVIEDKKFSHASFILHPSAEHLIYKPTISFFNSFNKN